MGGYTPAGSAGAVAGIGVDGSADYLAQFDEQTLAGLLFGLHQFIHILFIIPEAVGSINSHNTAILTELQKFGHVDTIVQTDALTYPDFAQYNMIVCGTDNGTAWTTSNLAHVKEFPEGVLCVDASVAAFFAIGADGGDAASKTVLVAITEIEANDLGIGHAPDTGLAAGSNTVSSSTTFNTIDMSDADITETFFGTEAVADNTDVLLAVVFKRQADGTRGIDSDGFEVPGSRWFYGCAYSANDLNTLGTAVLGLIIHMALQASTELGFEISGDIGDIEKKLFGNQANEFNNGNPMVEFLTGRNSSGTRLPIGKSIYDVLGAAYVDAGGGIGTDSILSDLGLIHDRVKATQVGVTQVKEFSITAAANAGVTTVATVTTQPCVIEKIIVHADAAQTGDMTSCAIEGGGSQVIEFISSADAVQANLDAADKQVGYDGVVRLAATRIITIDLQGTGATAVNLTVTIVYRAAVDGGILS